MAKQTRAERKKQNLKAAKLHSSNRDTDKDESFASGDSDTSDSSDVESDEVSASDTASTDSTDEVSVTSKEEAKKLAKAEKAAEKEAAAVAKKKQKRTEKERKAAEKASRPPRGPKFIHTFVNYLRNVKVEMKRVVWPPKRDVGRMFVIVLLALVFFGVILYAVDFAVTPLLVWFSELGG